MSSLVLNDEPISVSITSLVAKRRLFQTKPKLLGEPYRAESGVSSDSLRVFVSAIGGGVTEINDANVRDLPQLCDEFKFIELAKTIADWQAGHPLIDTVIWRELDLVRTALEERLESHARTIVMLDQAVYRGREAAISDAEKMERLRSLLGETAASVEKAVRDIDLVRAAAAEQQLAHGRDICLVAEEMERMREAIGGRWGSRKVSGRQQLATCARKENRNEARFQR
jgi:hypothetical protein